MILVNITIIYYSLLISDIFISVNIVVIKEEVKNNLNTVKILVIR